MIKPIPNVLYNEEKVALKRLYEFKVITKYVHSNKTLPGHVFEYYRLGKKDTVVIKVAKAPKGSFSYDKDIDHVYINKFVTGPKSINKKILKKAKANATDLGIPVDLNDRIIYLYGDTFSGNDCNIGIWNSNFIAVSRNLDFVNGIKFDSVITDENGVIKPICQGLHHRDKKENLDISLGREVTKIPTGGILIGEYVYVYMMHVRHWGEAGEWYVTHNQLYKAHKDKLDDFKPVNTVKFDFDHHFRLGQIYPFFNEFDEKYVYMISIPGGRNGNLTLLRTLKEHIEDMTKYEVCVGKGKYLPLEEGLKEEYYILSPKVSEPSIMYNHYLNKWIITTIGEDGHYMYLNDDLDGIFTERKKILTHKELVSFYGGFVHPRLSAYNDKKLYLQYSQWSPIYNTSIVEIVFK